MGTVILSKKTDRQMDKIFLYGMKADTLIGVI